MYEGPLRLIINNVEELRRVFISIIKVFFVFFLTVFFFKIYYYQIYSYRVPLLYPSPYYNIGDQFFDLIEYHLIQKKFTLIFINSSDGVAADLYSCLFLSIMVSSPWITYKLSGFIAPALKKNEREALRKIIIPAFILFIIGSFIGIYYVAPDVFTILYYYDKAISSDPTIGATSFISFFLIYVLSFGIAFETPVLMVGLTRAGIVPASYWSKNWRYAVVGALIFGVIFSPGQIGFTMMLLALPIMGLYFGGIVFAKRFERRKKAADEILQ